MDRIRLTDAIAERASLPPGKVEMVLADRDVVGFGLRLRGQSKSWIVTYRPWVVGAE